MTQRAHCSVTNYNSTSEAYVTSNESNSVKNSANLEVYGFWVKNIAAHERYRNEINKKKKWFFKKNSNSYWYMEKVENDIIYGEIKNFIRK